MSSNFYHQFLKLVEEQPVVLATVTQIRGSVPREVGAKMLIWENGHTFDTIGGGAGEAKVIRQAVEVLRTGENQFVEIDLSGAPNRDVQGVCGGWMQVWLSRWQGEGAIALIQNILQQLQVGQPITLVSPLNSQQLPFLQEESLPDALEKPAISKPEPFTSHGKLLTNFLDFFEGVYVETIQPPPTLLIVGAGHVGVALAKVAVLSGFAIAIQDDRPEFACDERFPEGSQVFLGAIASVLEEFCENQRLFIALVTRGYQQDLETLEVLWKKRDRIQPEYIGMIGSHKRARIVFQELEKIGIDQDWLNQIYAPIGISIGAFMPEEIAVSICAELIKIRRYATKKGGSNLSFG